ncbi:hypothetical protein F5B22DRAFT_662682 [Xylaria bambusicola]|uniref:uncharacterized protein n=1 Tax=Xylaria bambusicola TaxID=326684 RepID=UPI002007BF59|nr:uncharacterized protein F5B22DRAFT_662682 [Xylaria bambusicola]KAI0503023.1 hypothetical protein F5B22DRAFT_662682 [Xylaria bambusicola]
MQKAKGQVMLGRNNTFQSLYETIVIAITTTFVPWFLLKYLNGGFLTFWVIFAFYQILADTAPRLQYFTRECRWTARAIALCLIISMASLLLELIYLFRVAIGGRFPRSSFIVASLIVSTLARALYQRAGGNQTPKEERVGQYTSQHYKLCAGSSPEYNPQNSNPVNPPFSSPLSPVKEAPTRDWEPLTTAFWLRQAARRTNQQRKHRSRSRVSSKVSPPPSTHENVMRTQISPPAFLAAVTTASRSVLPPILPPVYKPVTKSLFQPVLKPVSVPVSESSESVLKPVSKPVLKSHLQSLPRTVSTSVPESFFVFPPGYRPSVPFGFPVDFIEDSPSDPLAKGEFIFHCLFPDSARIIPTIGDGLCGLHAIRNSIRAQAPHLPVPSVRDLLDILHIEDEETFEVCATIRAATFLGKEADASQDNQSWFLADHLGFIFHRWARTRDLNAVLGIRTPTNGGVWHSIHRPNRVHSGATGVDVIWIQHDGWAHYSGLQRL